MSWDLFAFAVPDQCARFSDIPENLDLKSLGSRIELIAKILEVAPAAKFGNDSWGVLETSAWAIEINIEEEENVTTIGLYVTGGEGAVSAVEAILRHLNVRALDPQTGAFFEAGDAAITSFHTWRSYRDAVLRP